MGGGSVQISPGGRSRDRDDELEPTPAGRRVSGSTTTIRPHDWAPPVSSPCSATQTRSSRWAFQMVS